jgi:hypothetical protein
MCCATHIASGIEKVSIAFETGLVHFYYAKIQFERHETSSSFLHLYLISISCKSHHKQKQPSSLHSFTGWTGAVPCMGHGTCGDGEEGTGLCTCQLRYAGVDCSMSSRPLASDKWKGIEPRYVYFGPQVYKTNGTGTTTDSFGCLEGERYLEFNCFAYSLVGCKQC